MRVPSRRDLTKPAFKSRWRCWDVLATDWSISRASSCRDIRDLFRQANPTPLKKDVPCVLRNVVKVVVNVRIRPHQVKVLRDLQSVHEIDWTISNHLVRQRSAIAVDVLRGHRVHVRQRMRVEPRAPLLLA